jgi:hypothetical protein
MNTFSQSSHPQLSATTTTYRPRSESQSSSHFNLEYHRPSSVRTALYHSPEHESSVVSASCSASKAGGPYLPPLTPKAVKSKNSGTTGKKFTFSRKKQR